MFNLASRRYINSLVYLLKVLLFIGLCLQIIISLSLVLCNKLNIFNLSIVLLLLYIINLFSYFFSIYQYSKYTSSIKFF